MRVSERKILVVDDEAAVRSLLRSALSLPGNQVAEAEDGREALSLAGQFGFFDLVVTDILMPGMDGLELARRLQKERAARRFLFISGYAHFETIDHQLSEFESATFLQKPFSLSELLRVARNLCEQPVRGEAGSGPLADTAS